MVVFFCTLKQACRFLVLPNSPVGFNQYILSHQMDFAAEFISWDALQAIPDAEGFDLVQDADVQVSILDASCTVPTEGFFGFVIEDRTVVSNVPAPKKQAETDVEDGMAADTDDGCFSRASSDVQSVASDVEEEAAHLAEEAFAAARDSGEEADDDDSGDEAVAGAAKVAAGSYVVENNGYFSFTNDPNYPDCKVRVLTRWTVSAEDGGLGTRLKSKSATIAHYDDDGEMPTRTMLVLRAWMLQRFQKGVFAEARLERRRWLEEQRAKLRMDICRLGVPGGGTGSVGADRQIRNWAPEVLMP